MNKRNSAIVIALLLAVVAILDFRFRGDLIAQQPLNYVLALGALFLFLYWLNLLLLAIPWRIARCITGVLAGVSLGLVYGVDYNYYSAYGRFMGPHEFSMLFGEFDYWRGNANNLFSNEELFSLVLYALPFLLVYSGLAHAAVRKVAPAVPGQNSAQSYENISSAKRGFRFRRILGSTTLQVSVVLVVLLGTLRIIKNEQTRFLLTPEFSTYYGVREYYKRPDTYKLKPPRVSFPVRKDDLTAKRVKERNPNIVLMLFESINMRHTSMLDYHRDTTPNLKSYIADNFQYYGISNSTTTTFATTSFFSGYDFSGVTLNHTLDYPLLWWYTKFAGYNNHIFTSQWLRYRSKVDYFIDRGRTDTLKEPLYSSRSLGRDDHITVSILKEELPKVLEPESTFLYINFAGTHFPYRVGEEYRKWEPYREKGFHRKYLNLTINQYDNALLYFDAAFKKSIDILKNNDLLENSVVILASDHGEAMMEHGKWGHGPVFYQEGIEVPIYIRIGKNIRHQFTEQELQNLEKNQSVFVSNVDVFMTILDITGVESQRDLSGRSLLKPYPVTVAVNTRDRANFSALHSHTGIKLIVSNKKRTIQCMNIRTDPDENQVVSYKFDTRVRISEARTLLINLTSCKLPFEKIDSS